MIIRQAAFGTAQRPLKGALHCHTTRSDGAGDPAAVIALHKQNGYDFMALTDHRLYNYKNFAPDVDITLLGGMEMDQTLPGPGRHCVHIVAVGPLKEQGNPYEQDQRFPRSTIERAADAQAMIDDLRAHGQLTIFAHPEWSGTAARDFDMLRGNFAMEIWNTACAHEFDINKDAIYWDELLFQGIRIYGVATDDGHKISHHCNGWVRVSCENTVPAILAALENGAFYSSCGPEIYDFYVEDGAAHVRCSRAAQVTFRQFRSPLPTTVGDALTGASCSLRGDENYIRAIVTDAQGRKAWTNPIWLG